MVRGHLFDIAKNILVFNLYSQYSTKYALLYSLKDTEKEFLKLIYVY